MDGTEVYFALVIENEIADTVTVTSGHRLESVLTRNPKAIDVTDFSYTPPTGAIWDGQDFNIPEELYPLPADPYKDIYGHNTHTFAYVVDGICIGRTKLFDNFSPMADRFIAAYQSNPSFVNITQQLNILGLKPFEVVGKTMLDGQIIIEQPES